jgi:two-component system KDP operon response regulator KdpE
MDGLDVLRELRTFSNVPVIVLSARGADGDRIKGLQLGADDYLAKPFNPDELVARIEAIGRRIRPDPPGRVAGILHIGNVVIDAEKRVVSVSGQRTHLTRIEWRLLNEFIANRGRLLLYEELLARVWGPEYRDDIQLLRTCVSRLRSRIEPDPTRPEIIRTIPRTGYLMDQDSGENGGHEGRAP